VAFTIATVIIVAAVVLWYVFRFYPERKVVDSFFRTLVAGDMNGAYRIWKPQPSYQMADFLADWGPNGYYGPVKSYNIIHTSSPRGSSTSVAVSVAISPYSPLPDASDGEKSRKTRIVILWIDAKDKSLSFPP
jgi:hypothetical protein